MINSTYDIFQEDAIDKLKIYRTIIDYQFEEHTYPYFKITALFWFLGFFIPLLTQIFFELDAIGNVVTTSIFLATNVGLFYVEIIQIKTLGFTNYIAQGFNRWEFFTFFVSLYFSINRMMNPDK